MGLGASMGFQITVNGDLRKTKGFLKAASLFNPIGVLEKYAKKGVDALSKAVPVDSGKTAASWDYEIIKGKDFYQINWLNSNINKGVPIAIILQYGHGTRNGGYVQGIDYINPAMRPIFDDLADEAWKEVTSK